MLPQATFSILTKKRDLGFSWNLGQSDQTQVSFVALIHNFDLNFKQTRDNTSFGFKCFHMSFKCRSFSLNFSWKSEFAQSWKSELNSGLWTHLDGNISTNFSKMKLPELETNLTHSDAQKDIDNLIKVGSLSQS